MILVRFDFCFFYLGVLGPPLPKPAAKPPKKDWSHAIFWKLKILEVNKIQLCLSLIKIKFWVIDRHVNIGMWRTRNFARWILAKSRHLYFWPKKNIKNWPPKKLMVEINFSRLNYIKYCFSDMWNVPAKIAHIE